MCCSWKEKEQMLITYTLKKKKIARQIEMLEELIIDGLFLVHIDVIKIELEVNIGIIILRCRKTGNVECLEERFDEIIY